LGPYCGSTAQIEFFNSIGRIEPFGGRVPNGGSWHIADDVLVGSKVRYLSNFSVAPHFSERPESAQRRQWSGKPLRFTIAQTRQRGDLVPKSPGIGRMSVKDAYFWNAPC
jgi:hypothetical protein